MILNPSNQIKLYGYEKLFNEFYVHYQEGRFPNKVLFSGQKGIGKSTFSYHLINSILSKNEEFSYDINKLTINNQNRTYKLIQNKSHPNFDLIDVLPDKKNIDINQIRDLLLKFNKSSFNSKSRFILIDNVELLNINSVNALLKFLEEPTTNTYFILIHNHKDIPSTLRSRCLEYKIFFSNKKIIDISNKLLDGKIFDLINVDLINYYLTPGKIYNLYQFCLENEIDIQNINLNDFLSLLINKGFYKKNKLIKVLIYDFIEFFLSKKFKNYYSNMEVDFLKKIDDMKRFNLDEETLFSDFKEKMLNG